jgi:hypothetical protein
MYCTLEEAFGGSSGSNFLSNRIKGDVHPVHRKRFDEEEKKKEEKKNNEYRCNHGNNTCQQVFDNNVSFNHQKKLNSIGLQQFPENSPHPQNYTFSPQYPWNPWARNGYLDYGNMFYGNSYQNIPKQRRVEHFGNQEGGKCNCKNNLKLILTYFIFFLISLAIVLSIIMICN